SLRIIVCLVGEIVGRGNRTRWRVDRKPGRAPPETTRPAPASGGPASAAAASDSFVTGDAGASSDGPPAASATCVAPIFSFDSARFPVLQSWASLPYFASRLQKPARGRP